MFVELPLRISDYGLRITDLFGYSDLYGFRLGLHCLCGVRFFEVLTKGFINISIISRGDQALLNRYCFPPAGRFRALSLPDGMLPFLQIFHTPVGL